MSGIRRPTPGFRSPRGPTPYGPPRLPPPTPRSWRMSTWPNIEPRGQFRVGPDDEEEYVDPIYRQHHPTGHVTDDSHAREQVLMLCDMPDCILFEDNGARLAFCFVHYEIDYARHYVEFWDHYLCIREYPGNPTRSVYAYMGTVQTTFRQEQGALVPHGIDWAYSRFGPVIDVDNDADITPEEQQRVVLLYSYLRWNPGGLFGLANRLIHLEHNCMWNETGRGQQRDAAIESLCTPSQPISAMGAARGLDLGGSFRAGDDQFDDDELPLQRPEGEAERPPLQQVMVMSDFTDYVVHDNALFGDWNFSPVSDRLVFSLSDDVDYDQERNCYVEHWHVYGRINQSRDDEQNDVYAYLATVRVENNQWTANGPTSVSYHISQQRLFPQTLDTNMYPTIDEDDQEATDSLVSRLNESRSGNTAPFRRFRDFIGQLYATRSDRLRNPTFVSTIRDNCLRGLLNEPMTDMFQRRTPRPRAPSPVRAARSPPRIDPEAAAMEQRRLEQEAAIEQAAADQAAADAAAAQRRQLGQPDLGPRTGIYG